MDFDTQKLAVIEALLPLCPFIAVDSRRPGCFIREDLVRPDLVLRLGRDPRVMGMPDLELTSQGFSATLSYQGRRVPVRVPWHAVSRIWVGEPFTGPIVIWPEDPRAAEPPPPEKPALRLVEPS